LTVADLAHDTRRAAATTVARHAHNPADLEELLKTLGLYDPTLATP
jgi:hypothetical protein